MKITYSILKTLTAIFAFVGVFMFLGSAGAFEQGSITFGRLMLQELFALLSIMLSVVTYIFSAMIKNS